MRILLISIVVVLSGCADHDLEKELMLQQQTYCDMVRIYKESGGENGWPDYKHNYEEVCK